MISVIIPTLNEEHYLPLLLEDLKKQSMRVKEIIVVDAGSKDSTIKSAKAWGAKVLISKVKNAGIQRNLGARSAKGDWLLFIDADMRLPKRDLLKHMLNINKDALVVRPKTTLQTPSWAYLFFVAPANFIATVIPSLSTRGGCMMVKRSAFSKVGGFNPALAVAEDIDLGRRLAKEGKTVILNEYVYESDRRYKKWGYLKTAGLWWLNGIWMFLFKRSWTQFWTPVR